MSFDLLAEKYNKACSMSGTHAAHNIIEDLIKETACNFPKDNAKDLLWFSEALKTPEKKWFAVQILEKVDPSPKSLFADFVLAALLERNLSSNKRYILPCIKTFGVEAVKAKIEEFSTHPGVIENNGVKNIQYWLHRLNV